jgi:hypothetical protein
MTVAFCAAAVVALAGCGRDRGGAPEGRPIDVVRRSADTTLHAGSVQVFIDGPDGRHAQGTVDLAARSGTLTLTAPTTVAMTVPLGGSAPAPFDRIEYTDPAAAIDMVRHAEAVDPFGGLLVRGAGTVRYDVNIRLPGQLPFFADVYVDSHGRVRRLTLPDDRKDHRLTDKDVRLARLITIDLVFK